MHFLKNSHKYSTHSFPKGISVKNKVANWELLSKFFTKHNITAIPPSLINDVIHSKNNAGVVLIETIFELLTNKKLPVYVNEFISTFFHVSN
jgi:hypothetical protein